LQHELAIRKLSGKRGAGQAEQVKLYHDAAQIGVTDTAARTSKTCPFRGLV
jgi:hypothetical protein